MKSVSVLIVSAVLAVYVGSIAARFIESIFSKIIF